MAWGKVGVPGILLAVLACGCGGQSEGSSTTHLDEHSFGGSATTSSGGSSTQGGGSSTQGSAGDTGKLSERCESVDGVLAYGKVGEPTPLSLTRGAAGECASCSWVQKISGFRTAAGYGFVWTTLADFGDLEPNLYSLSVDANFKGGEPQALLVEDAAVDLDVVPAKDGFVVATCLAEAQQTRWTWLNDDLDATEAHDIIAPGVPCGATAHPILWTGEGYLTSFADSRGVVVALLDEGGVVLGEEIVAVGNPVIHGPHLSKSGDRVLVVFTGGVQALYGVLDGQGTLLGDVQVIDAEVSALGGFAIVAGSDGWQMVSPALTGERGVQLTAISREGVVGREQLLFSEHDFTPTGFTPSASGGFLLVGGLIEAVQHAHTLGLMLRVDDAGDVVYSKQTEATDSGSWVLGVVNDPLKDLVIERHRIEGSETIVVQEYGCLN